MKIEFSHRSHDGVSIGVAVANDIAYLATSYVNVEAGDRFDRRAANRLISARLREAVSSGKPSSVVTTLPAQGNDARAIMRDLRNRFQDATFSNTVDLSLDDSYTLLEKLQTAVERIENLGGDVDDIRPDVSQENVEQRRDEIADTVTTLFDEAVREVVNANSDV